MNITKVKVGLLKSKTSTPTKILITLCTRFVPKSVYQDPNHYIAEVIEYQGQYYYRIDDTTIEVLADEYHHVIVNPKLYYFSSALRLHHRIQKARELGLRSNWPEQAAAPINIFELEKGRHENQ
jgi:hypothetical protein